MKFLKGSNRWSGHVSTLVLSVILLAQGANAAELALNWDSVTDPSVQHYEVSWGTNSGNYGNSIDVAEPPANLTGLSEGQKYFIAVRACSATKSTCSGYSNEISPTTSTTPIPDEPEDVVLSASRYTGTTPTTVTFTSNIDASTGNPEAVASYTFDNGTGSDSSGSGNDSVLRNGPVLATDTPDGSTYSLRFDGIDDHLTAGKIDLAGSGLTLSAWFKADDFSNSDPRLISKATGSAANDHLWMLGLTDTGGKQRLRARVRVGGSTTTLVASSGNLVSNTWYHAALTHDGTTVRLYLNGVQVGSTSLTGTVDVAPSVDVAIGSNPGAQYGLFRGLIDDIHILDKALDASALASLASGDSSKMSPTPTTELYLWVFGDGGGSMEKSPTHTYTQKGTYSVILYTNLTGVENPYQLAQQIEVTAATGDPGDPGDPDDPETPPDPEAPTPVASFSANIKSGVSPLAVTFSNSSKDATSYVWNFGDGQTSTAKTPKHTYSTPGTYSVKLTASGEGGSAVSYQGQFISVTASGLSVDFNADVTDGPAPLAVRFTSTTSEAASNYNWNFGDGTSSTQANPAHTYQKTGNYAVSLTVSGPDGTDTETKAGMITVEDDPEDNPLQLEVGEVQSNHIWTTVTLSKRFKNPVVLANPLSLKGGQPAVVQVKNVTESSFAIRLREWNYQDGGHLYETVGYIVVEAGSHQLPDGNWIEAGTIDLDAPRPLFKVGFKQPFSGNPVVLSTVASDNDPSRTAVITRMKNISSDGFEISLQKEEGLPSVHASEKVNYLAWQSANGEVEGYTYQAGSTANVVTHKPYQIELSTPFNTVPVILADMQTMADTDTANVRWLTKTSSSVTVMIDEETSADAEVSHLVGEVVGFLALEETVESDELNDASSLIHYDFDEGVGSSFALDSSGRGNNGVLAGDPAYDTDTGDGSVFSLRFDGTDDSVYAGLVDVSGSALTLSAWFKADSFPGDYRDPRLISKATSSSDIDHIFMLSTIKVDNQTRLRARVRTNGVTTTLIATSGNIGTGQWHHSAMTYDGAAIRLYLDGVPVGSTPASGAVATDPGVPVSIGGLPEINSRYFDGLIDNVLILERAMSASEIGILATGD